MCLASFGAYRLYEIGGQRQFESYILAADNIHFILFWLFMFFVFQELDIPVIVEDLAKKLKKHKNLHNIIPISTAKVPIVKFVDRCMQLDADISLYNCLAQANTRMLHAYAMIDVRVRQLVYTVKVFAKVRYL